MQMNKIGGDYLLPTRYVEGVMRSLVPTGTHKDDQSIVDSTELQRRHSASIPPFQHAHKGDVPFCNYRVHKTNELKSQLF